MNHILHHHIIVAAAITGLAIAGVFTASHALSNNNRGAIPTAQIGYTPVYHTPSITYNPHK